MTTTIDKAKTGQQIRLLMEKREVKTKIWFTRGKMPTKRQITTTVTQIAVLL